MGMRNLRKKIIDLISKNEYILFKVKYWRLRFLMWSGKFTSDERYIDKQYEFRTGRTLNLDKPELYNEKVQYAKLFFHDQRLKKLVDKYSVREYVSNVIGDKYLTKLYGVYERTEDIRFDELPD